MQRVGLHVLDRYFQLYSCLVRRILKGTLYYSVYAWICSSIFRDGILYWEDKMDCYICQCHDENWRWNDDCNRYFIVYKSNDENYSILYSSIRRIYRFLKMRRKKVKKLIAIILAGALIWAGVNFYNSKKEEKKEKRNKRNYRKQKYYHK